MKTPTEIHTEVGKHLDDYSTYRAFTVSDIAKIIADAKAEWMAAALSVRVSPADIDVSTPEKYKSAEANYRCWLLDKAESKGVCEWKRRFALYSTTCQWDFTQKDGHFCPGCGKEIKVV